MSEPNDHEHDPVTDDALAWDDPDDPAMIEEMEESEIEAKVEDEIEEPEEDPRASYMTKEAAVEMVLQRRAARSADYADRYAEARRRREAERPRVVDADAMFAHLRDAHRLTYEIEIEEDVVGRQDGTVMRRGEKPKPPAERDFSWETGDRSPIVLTTEAVEVIFADHFGDRIEDARRVVKLKILTEEEQALKGEVLALVAKLPSNRGNREPVAEYLGVSTRTISRWREAANPVLA